MPKPKLYAGQEVIYNGKKRIIDEVAPMFSREGNRFIAHERGLTLKNGNSVIWAFQHEVTPIEEEEPLMTTQTVNAADLLAKLEALTQEVAKYVAQEKASKHSGRQRVIEKAKAEVRNEEQRRERGHYTPIEFHINEKKGTVVALRKTVGGSIINVGKAKVSRDDKFDVHIGKVIAMRRALEQQDLDVYLNAPQN